MTATLGTNRVNPPTHMATWEELAPIPAGTLGIAVLGEGPDAAMLPDLESAALSEMGVNFEIVKVETDVDSLKNGLERLMALGFRGVNVGNPFKPSAARLAAHFYVVRHSLGTANALMLDGAVYAMNTEVTAFTKTLEGIPTGTALVMGAGQTGRAVSMALLEAGWKVKIWSRSATKARPTMTLLQRYGKIELLPGPDPVGCGLVVNATPLGLRPGELPPLNWNSVQRHTVVYDLVVRRINTELIRAATNRGLKTVDGRELLIEQAAQALEWWTGKPVPRGPMRVAAWQR